MSDLHYCLGSKIVAITGFVSLVAIDHPWWGLCCFLVVATVDRKLGVE